MAKETYLSIAGACHKVEVVSGHEKDGQIAANIRISVEDDGNWFVQTEFSSYWLPELIRILKTIEGSIAEWPNFQERFGKAIPEGMQGKPDEPTDDEG